MPRAALLAPGVSAPGSVRHPMEGTPMFLDALRATIKGSADLEEEAVQVRQPKEAHETP